MKNKYVLFLGLVFSLFFLNVNTSSAQQMVRFGVKAAIDVADNKVNSGILNVENHVGYQVGGVLEIVVPLTGFGVETGLLYGNKSYDIHNNTQQTGDISNLSYLQIPLTLKKRFSLIGIAGIYVNAGLFANIKMDGGELKIDNAVYGQNSFQTGLNLGAGVTLLNHIDVGMNYRYKFSDTYSDGVTDALQKVDQQTWNVSLAYLF